MPLLLLRKEERDRLTDKQRDTARVGTRSTRPVPKAELCCSCRLRVKNISRALAGRRLSLGQFITLLCCLLSLRRFEQALSAAGAIVFVSVHPVRSMGRSSQTCASGGGGDIVSRRANLLSQPKSCAPQLPPSASGRPPVCPWLSEAPPLACQRPLQRCATLRRESSRAATGVAVCDRLIGKTRRKTAAQCGGVVRATEFPLI